MYKEFLTFSLAFLVTTSSAHAQYSMIESDYYNTIETTSSDMGYMEEYGSEEPASIQISGSLPGGVYFCDINSDGELRLFTNQCFPDGSCIRVEVENGVMACNVESSISLPPPLPPILIQGNAQCTTQEISLNISAGFAEGCQGEGCVVGNGIMVECTANLSSGFDCSISAAANGQQLGVISVSGDPLAAAQTVVVKCGDLVHSLIETSQDIYDHSSFGPISPDSSSLPYTPEISAGVGISISF